MGMAVERKLGASVRKLISDYLVLLSANAIALGLSFCNTLLLTRWMGPESYGQWSIFLSIVNGLVLLTTNWSILSLVRYGCEEHVVNGTITQAFWARSVLLAASLAIVALGAYPLGIWLHSRFPALEGAEWLMVGAAATSAFSLHAQHAFQAVGKMKRAGYVQILERASLLGGIIILMSAGVFSLRPMMGVFLASGLLAGASLLSLRRALWLPPRFDGATIRGLLSFSAPYLVLYPFLFGASGYIDVLILANYMTTEDVGVYYFASQLAGLLTQVSVITCTVLIPAITRAAVQGRHNVIELYLERVLPYIIFLWSAVLSVVLLASEYVLPLVFGAKFRPAVAPFQLLVVSCGLAGIAQFAYAPILIARKWTSLAPIIGVSSGLANIGLDLLLIPILGTGGCALATVLTCVVSTILRVKLTRRRLALKGGLSIFIACLPLIASFGLIAYTGRLWLSGIGLLIVSYIVIRSFRLFRTADWELIQEMGRLAAPQLTSVSRPENAVVGS